MTFIKINENLYSATISGTLSDKDWDNRASKSITLKMSYDEAIKTFTDGLVWSIINRTLVPAYEIDENGNRVLDENGNPIPTGTETQESEFDNSEYTLAGDITDHRDGTITVKMGKLTDLEQAYEIILGGM